MLAYAAHRRSRRQLSPTMLAVILGGHAIALGLLVTARMDMGNPFVPTRTKIIDIPLPKPPEKTPPPPTPEPQPDSKLPPPPRSFIETPPTVVPLPQPGPSVDLGPSTQGTPDIGPALDTPLSEPARVEPVPVPPVRLAARAMTPSDLLRPPYPDNKRRLEEEAVLRLRLAIDPRGRVTAVEPVGAADPSFLAAARSHLLRFWRYKPATEDGRAVASSLVITLRFELEE